MNLCCEAIAGILEPITYESSILLLEKWKESLNLDFNSLSQQYHVELTSKDIIPSTNILQVKMFLEKWIQMTIERKEGLEVISHAYTTTLEEFHNKYLEKIQNISRETNNTDNNNTTTTTTNNTTNNNNNTNNNNENDETNNNSDNSNITDIRLYQNKEQKKILFEFVIELKLFLHSLSDKYKMDKRLTVAPVFVIPDNDKLQIASFSSIYHILSMVFLIYFIFFFFNYLFFS